MMQDGGARPNRIYERMRQLRTTALCRLPGTMPLVDMRDVQANLNYLLNEWDPIGVEPPGPRKSAARFQVPPCNPSPASRERTTAQARALASGKGCGLAGEVVAEHVGAGVGDHLAGFDRLRVVGVGGADHLDHGGAWGQVEG